MVKTGEEGGFEHKGNPGLLPHGGDNSWQAVVAHEGIDSSPEEVRERPELEIRHALGVAPLRLDEVGGEHDHGEEGHVAHTQGEHLEELGLLEVEEAEGDDDGNESQKADVKGPGWRVLPIEEPHKGPRDEGAVDDGVSVEVPDEGNVEEYPPCFVEESSAIWPSSVLSTISNTDPWPFASRPEAALPSLALQHQGGGRGAPAAAEAPRSLPCGNPPSAARAPCIVGEWQVSLAVTPVGEGRGDRHCLILAVLSPVLLCRQKLYLLRRFHCQHCIGRRHALNHKRHPDWFGRGNQGQEACA